MKRSVYGVLVSIYSLRMHNFTIVFFPFYKWGEAYWDQIIGGGEEYETDL